MFHVFLVSEPCFMFSLFTKPFYALCLMLLAVRKKNSSGFVHSDTLSSIFDVNYVFFIIGYECGILQNKMTFHGETCPGIQVFS